MRVLPGSRRSLRHLLLSTVLVALAPAAAEALLFQPLKLDDNRTVLVVRDCGKQGFKDAECPEGTGGFSTGDSARLRMVIGRRFDEIWLISGGGSLDEGIKVGEVFREFQATVRVPKGYNCVSACTVAFMGGLFRIVDPGATYEVHAASGFLNGFDSGYAEGVFKRLSFNPQEEYARFATEEAADARRWAARLVLHFQQGLLPLGRTATSGPRLQRWLLDPPRIPYLTSPQLIDDAERFRREGAPAAQETLMRLERDSMAAAIESLRAILGELGPRAAPALDMLESMYSSRITFTASLSQETLLRMGYVTTFVTPPTP